jgi:hypothetical protein
MISSLLMMIIIQMSTMGSRIALSTCVQIVMEMSGAPGSRMTVTPIRIMSVNSH